MSPYLFVLEMAFLLAFVEALKLNQRAWVNSSWVSTLSSPPASCISLTVPSGVASMSSVAASVRQSSTFGPTPAIEAGLPVAEGYRGAVPNAWCRACCSCSAAGRAQGQGCSGGNGLCRRAAQRLPAWAWRYVCGGDVQCARQPPIAQRAPAAGNRRGQPLVISGENKWYHWQYHAVFHSPVVIINIRDPAFTSASVRWSDSSTQAAASSIP